jgi:hypothetical protein
MDAGLDAELRDDVRDRRTGIGRAGVRWWSKGASSCLLRHGGMSMQPLIRQSPQAAIGPV